MVKLEEIREYWETHTPGLQHSSHIVGSREFFDEITLERYQDPFKYSYLTDVAEFGQHKGEDVLEIGVGMGTDLLQFAKSGSNVFGIDLTSAAVDLTRARFKQEGLKADIRQANFTEIPFDTGSFDVVYCFGVLHHAEETEQGISEIYRVLKPGGLAITMLYHKGFKYYIRKLLLYGILKGEFLQYNAREIVSRHSEDFGNSPLTKVYSRNDAKHMFSMFDSLSISCHRIDDYIRIGNRHISPLQSILSKRAYQIAENLFGWNMVIKSYKHLH